MDYLEKRFEKIISELPENERVFVRNIKIWMFKIYNSFIKFILWAVFLFWLFDRIKKAIGIQEAIYVQLTVIILYLRLIASRLV